MYRVYNRSLPVQGMVGKTVLDELCWEMLISSSTEDGRTHTDQRVFGRIWYYCINQDIVETSPRVGLQQTEI